MPIHLNNKNARHLFLSCHGLCENPAAAVDKSDILRMIELLGFVQVDSIRTVERAHHQILFSRLQTYKHKMLEDLLERDRELFENWTHDAAIIPARLFPYWKHLFAYEETNLVKTWEKWGRKGFTQMSDDVIRHISENGPTLSRDLKSPDRTKKTNPGWWDWHPAKTTLEYLWRSGYTSVAHRKGFQKAYDLSERVIPGQHFRAKVSKKEFEHWACNSALKRLGFATHGEIAAFWNLIPPDRVKKWVAKQSGKLISINVSSYDRKSTRQCWTTLENLASIDQIAKPPSRLRVLSPFDPMLRDRKRAEFLFGFRFRVEMFVPAAKREYGYYVFPILQGDKIIGRIDMKANRKTATLNVRKIWAEEKINWSKARKQALSSELTRLARFTGLENINYAPDSFIT